MDYAPEDFLFVGNYANAPTWLVVKSDAPWKNLREFVEEAKKSPQGFKICSFGKTTRGDYVMELLNKHAGLTLKQIPFKSSAEALTALLGGHGDAAIATGAGGLTESGAIRILAVAEEKRLDGFPGVPTFKEFGYDVVSKGLYTLCLPNGVPKEVYDKFCVAQKKAIDRYGKELGETFQKVEIWADFLNPEETVKLVKQERERVGQVAKDLGWGKE
jgi:tripartite-type tricarboxylate transporter receptor subunit TctC